MQRKFFTFLKKMFAHPESGSLLSFIKGGREPETALTY
jgi:hypothetical protein